METKAGVSEVSVILPVFNPDPVYLAEAVRSIQQQTCGQWELVVIDDGSTEQWDQSIVTSASARLFRLDRNSGVPIARNTGIFQASAEFIAFMDQDDLWHADKLQRQVELMRANQEVGLCFSDCTLIDAGSQPLGYMRCGAGKAELDWGTEQRSNEVKPLSYPELLEGAHIFPSSVLVRKSALMLSGLFDPLYKLGGAEDLDLWLKLVLQSRILHMQEALCSYRTHGGNTGVRNIEQWFFGVKEVLSRHAARANMEGRPELAAAAHRGIRRYAENYGGVNYSLAVQNLHEHKLGEFVRCFFTALTANPKRVAAGVRAWLSNRLSLKAH